jgi:hypothetical protein
VSINGLTEDPTKENGKTIKCMEEVFSLGLMAEDTKESMLRIKSKVREPFTGQTAENTLAYG